MFRLRAKVLQYGREHLITEGFIETHTPKIVATATEGGTDLFPMTYFDTPAFLNQSPQLFKQLCMSGGWNVSLRSAPPSVPRSTTLPAPQRVHFLRHRVLVVDR